MGIGPILANYFGFSAKDLAENAEDNRFALCAEPTLPFLCSVIVIVSCFEGRNFIDSLFLFSQHIISSCQFLSLVFLDFHTL